MLVLGLEILKLVRLTNSKPSWQRWAGESRMQEAHIAICCATRFYSTSSISISQKYTDSFHGAPFCCGRTKVTVISCPSHWRVISETTGGFFATSGTNDYLNSKMNWSECVRSKVKVSFPAKHILGNNWSKLSKQATWNITSSFNC